jgi:hypothetical protein
MADKMEPLPKKIPRRPFFLRVDITSGKNVQSQEIGEPEGTPLVIDLFDFSLTVARGVIFLTPRNY